MSSKTIPALAINSGPDFHLLDHIAPLAEILGIPLMTTEEKNFLFAQKYYPEVKTEYVEHIDSHFKFIANHFEVLFECKYWAPHLSDLFKTLYQKHLKLIFCPHGFSDKGLHLPVLEPYRYQEGVLLYGKNHIQMLKKLNIWPLKSYVEIGNYRYLYYLKHQKFLDDLAQKEIFSHFLKNQPLVFYAPTWNDAENSTSFFSYFEWLLSHFPDHYNLLIKVHPLLEQRDPVKYYRLEGLLANKPNILLVSEFPPVYPLLKRADLFIGDFSSVGYDFLKFQKPMYFFPSHLNLQSLQNCGKILEPKEPLSFSFKNPKKLLQKKLYDTSFKKISSLEEVKEAICSKYC